jgi:hypothetical protein
VSETREEGHMTLITRYLRHERQRGERLARVGVYEDAKFTKPVCYFSAYGQKPRFGCKRIVLNCWTWATVWGAPIVTPA